MAYLNGIRRVFGRVKIVYADKDVSTELKATASGDSEISNKEQVVMGYDTPTIKACTMDGNARMGKGYQMRDKNQICGWWSDKMCDGVGNFSAPFPYLDVSFIARPVIEWLIVGDIKLNQFPVDFELICFNAQGIELARESVKGNDKPLVNIAFTVVPINVTRIRLEIHKWNTQNSKAKIMSFYTLLEEQYEGTDLKEFEVLSELSEQTDNVTYGISSDTATFVLYNRNRKFDRGYLNQLVLLDRKVIPYIGIETADGKIEYTQLGEYYTDHWNVPQDESFAKVQCVDKLIRLQDVTYLGYPLTENGNLYDVIIDILTKADYGKEDYIVDETIKNMVVERLYLPKGNSWDSLQEVLASRMLKGYINKQGKLVVSGQDVKGSYQHEITPKHILKYSKQDKMTEFANQVTVSYSEIKVEDTLITVYEGLVNVEPLGETKVVLDYNGIIANADVMAEQTSGISILSQRNYPNCSEIVFNNTNGATKQLKVTIKGQAIKINTQNLIVSDNESIDKFGVKAYNHNTSFLVQSYDKAKKIANDLLDRLSMRSGRLDITFRGDPSLDLEQTFKCSDRFNDVKDVVCEFNRYVFDGGLQQQTKGRIIK